MKRRLLTLDDLYGYFSCNSSSVHFNSTDDDADIIVQQPGNLYFEDDGPYDPQEGLLPVVFKSCHTGVNLNKTSISDAAMKEALPSFSNRPVLGFIHEVDGEYEFCGHNRHIDEDDGIVYDEAPVGIIPESCDAHLEYDEENGKTYVVVKGYIFEEYTKAADILRREKECPVSVELSVRELSYSAEEKVLVIDSFYFTGVTILGKNDEGEEVKPGMEGANVTLVDFDQHNNSLLTSVDVGIEKKIRKEENSMDENKELLNAEEVVEEEPEVEPTEGAEAEPEESEAEPEEVVVVEEAEEQEVEAEEDTPADEYSVQYSVTLGDVHKEFSLSLNDVIYALQELVNDTYSEVDDAWYGVQVYGEDKYVIMVDSWREKAYKQYYSVRKGVYSLVGDRVPVYSVWVTEDERKALDNMRDEYESIKEKLAKYEAEPQKMEILNSEEYAKIADTEEFKALASEEGHFDLSVEEVSKKADEILLSYAKHGKVDFSHETIEEEKKVTVKHFAAPSKKARNYGSLLSDIK